MSLTLKIAGMCTSCTSIADLPYANCVFRLDWFSLEELAGIITQKDKKQLSDGIAQSSTESMLGSGVPGDGKSVESGGAAGSTTLEVANDDAALLVRAKFMVYLRERIVVDEQSHRPESRQFKPEEVLQSMAASVHFLTNGNAITPIQNFKSSTAR